MPSYAERDPLTSAHGFGQQFPRLANHASIMRQIEAIILSCLIYGHKGVFNGAIRIPIAKIFPGAGSWSIFRLFRNLEKTLAINKYFSNFKQIHLIFRHRMNEYLLKRISSDNHCRAVDKFYNMFQMLQTFE